MSKITHAKFSHNNVSHGHVDHKNVEETAETWFWIVGTSNATGRRIIYGCRPTYEEAETVVDGIHNATCEILPLNTRSDRKASQIFRAQVLGETGDIDKASKRFKHENR